jgi:tetratricopeptide (TPR) repeat protein
LTKRFSSTTDALNDTDLSLLSILIKLKEHNIKDVLPIYSSIRRNIKIKPYPLLYTIDTLAINILLKDKRHEDAVVFIKDATLFAPSASEQKNAYYILIQVYKDMKEYVLAASAIKRYVHRFPNAIDMEVLLFEAGHLLFLSGDLEGSIKLYESIKNNSKISNGTKTESAVQLSKLFVKSKKYKDAQNELLYILKNSKNSFVIDNAKMSQAAIYIILGQHKKALAIYSSLINSNSKLKSLALLQKLKLEIRMKQFNAALSTSELLLKENDKNNVEATYLHAFALDKLGKKIEAAKEYKLFFKRFSKNKWAEQALSRSADLYFEANEVNQSIAVWNDYIIIYANSKHIPYALNQRLKAHYMLRQIDKVIKDVSFLQEKYSDSSYAINAGFWLLDYYRNKRDFKKALIVAHSIYDKFKGKKTEQASKNMEQALYEIIQITHFQGDDKECLKSIESFIELFQQSHLLVDLYFLKGDIKSDAGEYEVAIVAYQKVLELKPKELHVQLAARCRIADCLFSLYGITNQKKYVVDSRKEYMDILKQKNLLPMVRYHALYGSARCNEELEEMGLAIAQYKDLKMSYSLDKEKHIIVEKPIWVFKGIIRLIDLYLKKNSRDGINSAIELFTFLVKNKLGPQEGYEEQIKMLKNKLKTEEL